MSDKWEALRALARQATRGPWRVAERAYNAEWQNYDRIVKCDIRGGVRICDCLMPINAQWIAAANPSAIAELLAERDRLAEQLDAARADAEPIRKLAAFGWACLQEHRQEMADIDGFAAQDMAIAAGVLVTREVTEPCGEGCQCAEFGFPSTCYFIDADCRAVGATLERVAAEERPGRMQ